MGGSLNINEKTINIKLNYCIFFSELPCSSKILFFDDTQGLRVVQGTLGARYRGR